MKKFILLLCCSSVLALSAAVTTPNVKLSASGNQMFLNNLMQVKSWNKAAFTPFMYDGKSKTYAPVNLQITETADTLTFVWENASWKYTTRFSARQMLILGESTLTNKNNEELFLEPGFTAAADFSELPGLYWDGFGKMRPIGDKPLTRNGIKGKLMKHIASSAIPFAGSGVMTKTNGIHLGHVMFDPVSYSASGYDPVKKELRFSQRVAIHPRETLKLRWVAGAMDATYGGAEAAVQQHYDAFPELWQVSGGQNNPYVWGNHAHYRTWWIEPVPEEVRRFKITCEWTYTPYKRSGDMLCRPELWDYRPNNPFRKKAPRFGGHSFAYPGLSREDYLKMRKERYLKYGKKYGWLFYNTCSGTWCEIQLAKSKYPDSLTSDPNSPNLLKGWSTGHDWEVRVFPMGTSFDKVFRSDMKVLTEELDLPGFALDCGSGGVYYRGPAVKKHLPGRAWDDEGVFIDQSVAINDQVDYIHSLRPENMTVFINGPLKGDIVMYEESLVELAKLQRLMPLAKWHAGPRPTVSHGHGWEYRNLVPNWRSKNTAEFCDIISKMSDHMIFSQFQLGINTTYISMSGNPQQIYILPEYDELKRAGWNSLVPMQVSKSIYAPYQGCYGKAQNSFLFLGNSRPNDCQGEIKVDNELQSRQKNTALLFVRKLRNQAATLNRVDGKYTAFDAVLPSRVPVLFESVCAIEGAGKLTAQVSTNKNLNTQTWSAVLNNCTPFTGKILPRDIRGFTLEKLELNGKPIQPGTPVALKSGDKISGSYTSDTFKISREDIARFPFTNAAGRISCRLHVPAGDRGAKAGADRFNAFFSYLKKQGFMPNVSIAPRTSNNASLQRHDVITFATGAKENTISKLPGGGIKIQARDAGELEKLTCKLLDEMDARYPYVIPFRPVMGLNNEMIYSAKMQNKSLPLRKYFE